MINPNDILYAVKLKALRKSRKIKQAVFAELMGWKGQQECSDYEKSKKHFTDTVINKLCEVLAVSTEEFMLASTPLLKTPKRKVKLNRNSNSEKEELGSAVWPQDPFIAINLKKILLEKELKIKELELKLAHSKPLQYIKQPEGPQGGKIYVII
jgi:transcriptional regulator with XRE-family HTH domain